MGQLKGKRILVTGGNGYLGCHVVAALKKEGAKVFVLDRITKGGKNEFKANIENAKEVAVVVQKIKPNIIYHLAASLNRDRDFKNLKALVNANYIGTLNLLRALENIDYDNFIFTSTSEIYGSNKTPFHEKQPPSPVSPYSISKVFAETAIQAFSRLHSKNYTILRLFNFFGKNMSDNFFIPQLIYSLKNEPVFKMTKGMQARDFLYIDDVVQSLLLSAINKNAMNETFNVCSSKSVTLKKLVLELKKKLKSECKIDFGALPYRDNEIWNMIGSNKKIKMKIGFKPKYDLSQGFDELIN
ncbi:MAG: NAD-dependent epimerase/dehydratase family protein [Bacteroidia bacterium]